MKRPQKKWSRFMIKNCKFFFRNKISEGRLADKRIGLENSQRLQREVRFGLRAKKIWTSQRAAPGRSRRALGIWVEGAAKARGLAREIAGGKLGLAIGAAGGIRVRWRAAPNWSILQKGRPRNRCRKLGQGSPHPNSLIKNNIKLYPKKEYFWINWELGGAV